MNCYKADGIFLLLILLGSASSIDSKVLLKLKSNNVSLFKNVCY